MKNKQPLNLKHIAVLYLITALILLLFFRYAVRSDSALQYAGEILSGLITMVGIYYAFADSERDRAIETRPRFSASVSSWPATPDDSVNRPYVFFAGGPVTVGRHLSFTLHNEGSTEINILGIFIGKACRKNELHWLPYLTYQLNWNIENGNQKLVLFHENLDINASVRLTMDVANKIPNDADVEDPVSEQTRNRFVVEVWYQNDYSPACYVKHYIVEHIPLEHWTKKTASAWDQSLDCHAYTAVEKTMSDFREQCRSADEFNQLIIDAARRRKQNNTAGTH
ncbi:MAG: hypothetical protein IKG53_09480 [Solobacterium sp.]|nr:hypothetical protein [Solobacterium sp.]